MPHPMTANGFTITKQTLSYLLHQLQGLRTVSNKLKYDQNQQQEPFNSQSSLTHLKQEIQQRVYLMEKKLEFSLGYKSQGQFEDFVTQFYQQEISKVRQQLAISKEQLSFMQRTVKQQQQQQSFPSFYINDPFTKLSTPYNNTQQLESSTTNDLLLIQQRQESIKLKKQLSHCRQLLQQNQHFINEQNLLIKQLSQQIIQIQQRQSVLRTNSDNLVIKYDGNIKQRAQKFKSIQKQFSQHRKVYEKQLKQLQITNSYLYQQKQALQSQLVTKSDQLTLLTKKIYQLQLTINKYQRQLTNKASQNVQSDQAILLLNDEVGLWKKKCYEMESAGRERVRAVQEEKGLLEGDRRECVKQLEELKHKITTYYQPNQLNQQKKLSLMQNTITTMRDELNKLQAQLHSQQLTITQKEKVAKQLQKQLSISAHQRQSLNDRIKQLQQQLAEQQKMSHMMFGKQNQQKSKMKKEIYNQVEELLRINNETVKRIKVQQLRIKQLTADINQKQSKIQTLQQMSNKLQALNEQLVKRNSTYMKQLQQHKDIIAQMENQLKAHVFSQGMIDKGRHQVTQKEKHIQQQQKLIAEQEKLLKALQKQFKQSDQQLQQEIALKEELQQQLNELKATLQLQHSSIQNQHSLGEEIVLLKQEHCKKDFLVKQLQSKIALLQQQLRQTEEVTELQRHRMKLKIKQLQQLLKERYDFSNRPSNEG